MTTLVIIRHLVATLWTAMWHLDFILTNCLVRRGDLTHLGWSPPMSVCGTWPSFMSRAVIGSGGCSLSFVGSRLCLWTVVFVFWLVVVTGHSWVVIGVGCHVVVAVGGVVGLWLWLVEGRSDVTGCDINQFNVMFKLTCEITCTISCDFLAVYSKNPSVLVQSSAEVKFSPQGWSQSC